MTSVPFKKKTCGDELQMRADALACTCVHAHTRAILHAHVCTHAHTHKHAHRCTHACILCKHEHEQLLEIGTKF